MKWESFTENLAIFRWVAICESHIHRITWQSRDK